MNQMQAINQAMKTLPLNASSVEIFKEANKIVEQHKKFLEKQKEWNSIATLPQAEIKAPQSNYSVIRELKSYTIVEFLGEEFWLNLSLRDKIIAKDVYDKIRAKFEA